jgi:hypothetical protein
VTLGRPAALITSGAVDAQEQPTQEQPMQTQPQLQQALTTATVPTSPKLAPVIANWQQALVTRLARFQRYPAHAKGATGVVNLSFSIDRQGHVLNGRVIKSSGSVVLDPCSHVPRHCRRRRPQLPIAISLSSFRSVSYSGDASVTRFTVKA